MVLFLARKQGHCQELNATSMHCLTLWEPCLLGFAAMPLDVLLPVAATGPALQTNPAASLSYVKC